MGILPGPLQDPCESEELVRSSTSGAKTALFLFNLRFDDRPNPPFQHLGVDFTREAEKCDTPIIELKRICLSYKRLEKWCHMPFFATTVTGCFVRVDAKASISVQPYCVAEIVSVMETKNVYQLGSNRTNLVLKLRHAGKEQISTPRYVSRQEFTMREFMQWKLKMMAAGTKVPTSEMIASKDKSIKEALDHTFTHGEIDLIVALKKQFRAAPLNVAKRKLQLFDQLSAARSQGDADMVKEIQDELKTLNEETKQLSQVRTTEHGMKITIPPIVMSRKRPAPKAPIEDYHNTAPFTRKKTRPMLITSLKNESVCKAVYAELDLRYDRGFQPENED
ncbi:unnamed protein product [Pleuronectes platessa]|uniref:Plus3 domain-containing protein n=1 Tax=Pleuronectes platessa TaxID=8262 RepID=A0A9N7VD97_PLEPL|nr:unnamed protein product [Pleuronectes platessa]